MYEWRNAKVTANVRKAFEIATDIAWTFDDEKLRSAYLLFAAMNIPDSAISKVISDMYAYMLPDLGGILQDKEIFADIFGKEAAEKNFAQEDDEESEDGEAAEEEHDEITEKVLEVFSGLMSAVAENTPTQLEAMEPNYSDKLEAALDEAYRKM